MSVETITILLSLLGLVLTLAAGFAWTIRRTDSAIARSEDRAAARFERLETKIDARFEVVDEKLGALDRELVEVKVAVARLEGPLVQRLAMPR